MADGSVLEVSPMAADAYEKRNANLRNYAWIWSEKLFGAKSLSERASSTALDYIKRIEELTGVPVDIISTGP